MANKPTVNVGDGYVAANATQLTWRVGTMLADGIHIVLVCENEPSLRKTVSISALADSRHFSRIQSQAA
jgi:hypothetical protein